MARRQRNRRNRNRRSRVPDARDPRWRRRWGGPGGGGGGGGLSGGGGFSIDVPSFEAGGDFSGQASRDVQAAFAPQFSALDQSLRRGEADASQWYGQIGNLYNQLTGALTPLGPALQQQVGQIQGNYQQGLESLVGMLPAGAPVAPPPEGAPPADTGGGPITAGTPQGEAQAAAGAFAAVGAGGLERLASAAQRGASYNASALRQAAIDSTNYRAFVMEELAQFREAIAQGRTDLAAQMAPMILSRIDELKARADELALARAQMQMDASLANAQLAMQGRELSARLASDQAAQRLAQQEFGLRRRTTNREFQLALRQFGLERMLALSDLDLRRAGFNLSRRQIMNEIRSDSALRRAILRNPRLARLLGGS